MGNNRSRKHALPQTKTKPLRQGPRPDSGEAGQIGLFVLGCCVLALTLVVGVVNVTALQLARARLYDMADGAALDAADALNESVVYRQGLGARVPVTDASVRAQAEKFLSSRPLPEHVSTLSLVEETGSSDGRSATVAVSGVVEMPLGNLLLTSVFGPVRITVASTAESRLDNLSTPLP
ncbi:pilus assembly protein TadG-related protein [Austwickia chelonae]|uniref:pilus assembly protein TadG-related protein n=1 Tax=Austwickia chelonae TaxID=100225 RepID=UPI0013C343CA|nr:pilus assembly protein TadG-related protein [Austwickia chelonae]